MRFLIYLLLVSACVPNKRGDDVVVQRDTIYQVDTIHLKGDTIYVEIEPSVRERYEDALRSYIGVEEETGNNDGEIVEFILKNCGFDTPQPWCGCFVNQGFLDIGLTASNAPAWSPAWFNSEKTVWQRDKDSYDITFQKGWTFGIYFRNKSRIAHVGAILEDFNDGYLLTIEGNSNSQGSREGNRVSVRIRHKSEIYKCSDWL